MTVNHESGSSTLAELRFTLISRPCGESKIGHCDAICSNLLRGGCRPPKIPQKLRPFFILLEWGLCRTAPMNVAWIAQARRGYNPPSVMGGNSHAAVWPNALTASAAHLPEVCLLAKIGLTRPKCPRPDLPASYWSTSYTRCIEQVKLDIPGDV